ncbi:hypothetical protein F5144DRAFT_387130 [Chaetomium tenue]|uniref:Uncharacterized protein n=1 Tax=Chaetomium tenue TaxID=1854479 RepID=A0ACB7NZ83_9PEZI|nr:hypothetical protein F5144DRAFT_387130 [Chaetomium globosum]
MLRLGLEKSTSLPKATMYRSSLGPWWALALLGLRASAACTSYGVDFSNGGSYDIDSESNEYFSFISVFQGCSQETISPVLVSPDDNVYACSDIKTQPAGTQVKSTCGIPYSAMSSGRWKIIIAGDQISSQRTITLTVGVPQTTRVTVSSVTFSGLLLAAQLTAQQVTPTVTLGYTTTAKAQTVLTTLVLTETLIIVPRTVTTRCSGATRTVTGLQQGPTAVVTSTAIRTVTDDQVTSYWTTTASETASCHYPSNKLDVAGPAAVAVVTVTYTQTTYTVTRTVVTTVPGRTTTELVVKTTTATV